MPELKALQTEHKIVLDGHYIKKELRELLNKCGVLPPEYEIGRRVTHMPALKEHTTPPPHLSLSLVQSRNGNYYLIRGHLSRAELTLIDDETFQPTDKQKFPTRY